MRARGGEGEREEKGRRRGEMETSRRPGGHKANATEKSNQKVPTWTWAHTSTSDPSCRHVEVNVMHAYFMFESRISKPTAEDYFSHLIKQRVSRFDEDGDNRILPCSDCCCCRAFRRSCHSLVPCELPDHDACLPDFRAGVATYPLTLLYHLWIRIFLSPIWVLTTFFITDSIHDSSHRVVGLLALCNLTS